MCIISGPINTGRILQVSFSIEKHHGEQIEGMHVLCTWHEDGCSKYLFASMSLLLIATIRTMRAYPMLAASHSAWLSVIMVFTLYTSAPHGGLHS